MGPTHDPAPGALTRREIAEQPETWRVVAEALPDLAPVAAAFEPFPEEIVLTGCGSSYYLAQAAAATFARVAGLRASAVPASEIIYFPEIALPRGRRVALVAISRSGETSETIAAARVAAARGAAVLGIGCEAGATLAGLCRAYLPLSAARDESMVMTKAFTTMLLALQRIAGLLAGDVAILADLGRLPQVGANLTYARADLLAALGNDRTWERAILLGAGPLHGIAWEAVIKLTEMSLTMAVAYHPLEFRHGPLALVDGRTLAILLAGTTARDQEAALVREIRARGGRVLALGSAPGDLGADEAIALDATLDEYARPALYLPPLQLLGYERALANGLDPDQPRYLNRYVALDLDTAHAEAHE
ncbi:MAG: SIS domain-containing protein [Chloroflexia bacterium]